MKLHASILKLYKIGTLAEVLYREFIKTLRSIQRRCSVTKYVQEHLSYRATPLAASEYLGIPFCKTFANGCLLKEGFLKLLKSYNNLAIL